MRSENSPQMAQREQEIEILLSNDFQNLKLQELKGVEAQLNNKWGYQNGEVCYLTDSQVKAKDFLYFRIKQEEHKDDKIQIGDVFYTSWGYEQTNREFYKVVGFTKSRKSAIIRQIGCETVPGSEGHDSDRVKPSPEFELKREQYNEDKHCFETLEEHKPDLRVKIERSTEWNPIKKERQAIGEYMLRGSVYYTRTESKHLQSLYKYDQAEQGIHRSWGY